MFILDLPISSAGSCHGTPCVDHVEVDNNQGIKQNRKQDTDSLGKASKPNPFGGVKPSETQKLNSALLSSGLAEENIDLNTLSPNSKTILGIPILEYLENNRYVFKFEDEPGKTNAPKSSNNFQDFYKEFERMREYYEAKLQGFKESQEMQMVFNAMLPGAYAPKSAISSLANLLGSLTFASSKQLAGSAINEIADYAARWAMRVAKNNPNASQMMKEISTILKGIIVDCLSSTQGGDSTSSSTISGGDCHDHSTPHIQSSQVSHTSVPHTHNHDNSNGSHVSTEDAPPPPPTQDIHDHSHDTTTTSEPISTATSQHTHGDVTNSNGHVHEHSHEDKSPVTINESEKPCSEASSGAVDNCHDETPTLETGTRITTDDIHNDTGHKHAEASENVEVGKVGVYDKYSGECVDEIPVAYYDYYQPESYDYSCEVVEEVKDNVGSSTDIVGTASHVTEQKQNEVIIEQKYLAFARDELKIVEGKISNLQSDKNANKNELGALSGQKDVLTRRIASA